MYRRVFSGVLLLFLAACSGGSTPHGAPTSSTSREALPSAMSATVTRSAPAVLLATPSAAYPAGCTYAEVAVLLDRFLDAFNRGDSAVIRGYFPTEAVGQGVTDHTGERFVWYSMTDTNLDGTKRHFVTYDLPGLWAYFTERHRHRERLIVQSFSVRPQDTLNANLTLNLYRTADDLPLTAGFPEGVAVGKGVLNCRNRTFRVLSFGQYVEPRPTVTLP